MAISKNKRLQVYAKYDGHCAYCGSRISYKDMQVDHIQPKAHGGTDEIANLNPSCRMCNFRKGTMTLKTFRKEIRKQANAACDIFQVRMSLAYGLLSAYKDKKVEFYFEKKKLK